LTAQSYIRDVFVLALLVCATSSSQLRAQNSGPGIDSIANALREPGTRIPIGGSSRSTVFLNTVTVPSGGNEKELLTLVWVVFPRGTATLRVCSVNKIGPANLVYERYSPKDALAVINGGFYGFDSSDKGVPVGLLISEGNRLSDFANNWTSGGILLVRNQGDIEIVPIDEKNGLGNPREALQSKPLLIESGLRAVRRDRKDQPFNRSTIGITTAGDLVIAGAFTDDNQALTLVDFGKFLELLGKMKGVHITTALNLDGATDAHLHVISPTRHWGYEGSNYVPDVLAIVPR
jgi:hypothetical protein